MFKVQVTEDPVSWYPNFRESSLPKMDSPIAEVKEVVQGQPKSPFMGNDSVVHVNDDTISQKEWERVGIARYCFECGVDEFAMRGHKFTVCKVSIGRWVR